MSEIVYTLLLTGPLGLTLFGTLRYRFTARAAPLRAAGQAAAPIELRTALRAAVPTSPLAVVRTVPLPVAGTLSVPLITGLHPVPIHGVAIITLETGALAVFSGSDPARPLLMKFADVGGFNVAGGLSWRPLQPGAQTFSLLSLRTGSLP